MTKLELFEHLEIFLRVYPEMKDRFISLKELGIQALEEQIEKYGLSEFITKVDYEQTRILKINR